MHDGHVSITGVTDDKNALGMICMLFALTVSWGMLKALRTGGRRDKRLKRLLIGYGAVLTMAVYIVSIANSATATACLILGAGVMILTSLPRISKRPRFIHLIVAAALGVSAVGLFADAGLLVIFGRNPSLTGRTDLWNLCLGLVTNPLVGAGYESFWLGWRLEKMWNYIMGVNQAHNGYLEIYLNLGWMGVALLVTILISGYRNIVRAVRRQEAAASLRLAFFVVVCVYNVTEAGFKMVHPIWIALLVVSAARPALVFARQRRGNIAESVSLNSQSPSMPVNEPTPWLVQ
jgi:O-antigen ligase